jgi:hypothetical protein
MTPPLHLFEWAVPKRFVLPQHDTHALGGAQYQEPLQDLFGLTV